MNPGDRIIIYKTYLHRADEIEDRGMFKEHGDFSCVYRSDDGELKRAEINRMAEDTMLHCNIEHHKRLLKYFGTVPQVLKFAEELNELSSRLIKWACLMQDTRGYNQREFQRCRDQIDLEFSDVRNMLPRMDMIFAPVRKIQETQFIRALRRME